MAKALPNKALVYIIFVSCLALTILAYTFLIMDWDKTYWFAILVFLVMIILADLFPVTLPHGGKVSVSFATIAASILLFQPFIVILISVFLELFLLIKEKERIKHFFNVLQYTVATGSAALVYRILSPGTADFSVSHIPAFIIAMIVIFLLNTTLVTLILAFTKQEDPYAIWLINLKWATPTFISMVPLGALIAVIYINIGFWGLVLFLLPLIIARHSFQSYMDMREAFLDTIKSLSLAIDAKDPYTKGHSSRVADYVVLLARELKMPEDKIEFLHYISMIHDVGKIIVPEHILKKDTGLSREEYNIMKQHSRAGADIIKDVHFFAQGSDIIKFHHERWDGHGYPDNLKEEEIPEGARILAVADAYDAMTTNRPYRKSMNPKDALHELRYCSGSQFEPRIVEAFEQIYPKLVPEAKDNKKVERITQNALNRA
ncbi:MAG: HD-GYP domain-containing protein [Bacillota bacterium]